MSRNQYFYMSQYDISKSHYSKTFYLLVYRIYNESKLAKIWPYLGTPLYGHFIRYIHVCTNLYTYYDPNVLKPNFQDNFEVYLSQDDG